MLLDEAIFEYTNYSIGDIDKSGDIVEIASDL
jgi:hypothetical protein